MPLTIQSFKPGEGARKGHVEADARIRTQMHMLVRRLRSCGSSYPTSDMELSKRTSAIAAERCQPVRSRRAKAQAVSTVATAVVAKTQTVATVATAVVATPSPRADVCFVATMGPMVLSIGSECSGWCIELQVARAVCPVPVRQMFVCDSAGYVRRFIQHCIKPTRFFEDLRTRGFDLTQHLDIYVCGCPCQAFSWFGLGEGMADREGRGFLITNAIAFFEATVPARFSLENVP
eukprot:4844698-Lingulodinium_polyedra.AAC.1